jgi:hypothetical protein
LDALCFAKPRSTESGPPPGKAHQSTIGQAARDAQTGILFTNDLVIRLVQGDVADQDILKMIATQPNRFALGLDDLVKLKQAGAPDAIAAAMQRRQVQP